MKLKKMLAFVSALCMTCMSVPVQGFAEETDVSALVQEVDQLNTDYSVSMKKLDVQSNGGVALFMDGYARVQSEAGKYDTLIDKDGNVVYTAQAGEIKSFRDITGSEIISDVTGFNGYSPNNDYIPTYDYDAGVEIDNLSLSAPCSYHLLDGTLLTGNYAYGGVMNDDVAVVVNVVESTEEVKDEDGDVTIYGDYLQASIINSEGKVLYTFPYKIHCKETHFYPDEDEGTTNEDTYYGYNAIGFGMPSEGLIGFFYTAMSESSNEWNWCHGYVDYEGNIVIPQEYSDVGAFSEGLAWVEHGGGTGHNYGLGYIDKSGEVVIPFGKYCRVSSFKNGLAMVAIDAYEEDPNESGSTWHDEILKYGYINKKDEIVIPFEYDGLQDIFSGDYIYAQKDGKYGYINKKNEVIIPFEYDNAYGTYCDLFTVVKDGKCGLLDKNNQTVIPMIFDDISACGSDGTVFAVLDNQVYFFEISPESEQTPSQSDDFLLGDADSSGEIDILDVITVNKAILGKENLSADGLKAIDFNGNGKPDSNESLTLLKYIVGIITDFNA